MVKERQGQMATVMSSSRQEVTFGEMDSSSTVMGGKQSLQVQMLVVG